MRNEFLNTTIADTDPEVSEAINKEVDEKMRNNFLNYLWIGLFIFGMSFVSPKAQAEEGQLLSFEILTFRESFNVGDRIFIQGELINLSGEDLELIDIRMDEDHFTTAKVLDFEMTNNTGIKFCICVGIPPRNLRRPTAKS